MDLTLSDDIQELRLERPPITQKVDFQIQIETPMAMGNSNANSNSIRFTIVMIHEFFSFLIFLFQLLKFTICSSGMK